MLEKKLVQICRLALTGKQRDVQLFIKRLAQELRESFPETSQELVKLLQEAPSPQSPFRNAAVSSVPVDRDSRLELLRIESPVEIEVVPIWRSGIEETLQQVISERAHREELLRNGITVSKSLLFTGPPGVGKTLAARWLASQLGLPLLVLDLSAVMSSYLGRTGSNLRSVFDYAKGVKCILLLDELDAIGKKRDDQTEIGELKRLVNVLLQEIDNWDDASLIVGATNHGNLLDPAIWRRFDTTIEFPMPDYNERVFAVQQFLRSQLLGHEDTAKIIAIALAGKSFNDIEREVLRIRRQSIVTGKSIIEVVTSWLQEVVNRLSMKERHDVALELLSAGFSQRHVNEITGVSRDTLRKKVALT